MPRKFPTKGRPPIEAKAPGTIAKVATALVRNNGNVVQTARECGLSRPTVRAILTRSPESFAEAKKSIAAAALANSEALALAVTSQDVAKMSGFQKIVAAKIAGQHANEMLGTAPQSITLNIGIVNDSLRRLQDLRAVVSETTAQSFDTNEL